ncbi:MAG: hypothetical protein ACRD9Q_00005 [Nitrososphaeraceae archaeon]
MNFLEIEEMSNNKIKAEILISLPFMLIIFNILAPGFIHSNQVFAAGKFSVEAKINLEELNNPDKLKVVASANGDNETKYLTGNELNSNTATVSFEFNQKNDVVTVGGRDEYFVCAYALKAGSNQMESYSCVEGNIEKTNGKNTIDIGSGAAKTLSTGSFQTVSGGEINDPTIRVWIPLSDRKDVRDLKIVTMIKGEFETKTIDAKELLKKSEDNTIIVPFVFNKTPEIGAIQKGDLFFACVAADELNPPEGTECEHRVTSHTGHIHNLVAR